MMERLVPILLPAIIVAGGLFIALAMVRKYRKELGLREVESEKTADVSFMINAFHDVTRQLKEKEKELHRLKALAEQRADAVESYTANILQCVSNGVITFDREGRVATINRAAEEMLGLTSKDAAGCSCRDIIPSEALCSLVDETIENRVPSHRMETAIQRDGAHMWLGFNTALLTDRGGQSLGVILSFSDLTEVKRLQEQIELKERLTALGEMSAGIAHELRNPMAVIAGNLKLLAKKQDADGQQVVGDVLAEIDGMNRIIGDLLTFARPTALNRVDVNIGELLKGCLDAALQAKGHDGIQTVFEVPDLVIPADEVLLRQALGNIIVNAIESMAEKGSLTIRGWKGEGEAGVAVQDTGHGIAPEMLKKIFLPFFTTKPEGVGMGLALAHKIVTAHGGRIEAISGQGRGSTFTVMLPMR